MTTEPRLKRITLRDIADACRLSVPTVSQILNERSNFSSRETRNLVRETAKRLGYRPNLGYKLMHGMRTKTVALILGYSSLTEAEYIQNLIYYLLSKLSKMGYATFFQVMPDDWSQRKEIMDSLVQRSAEHIIALGKPCEIEDLEELTRQTGVTAVTLRSKFHNNVNIDVPFGVTKLLEYFLQSGCKKIRAVVNDDPDRLEPLCRTFDLTPEAVFSIINYITSEENNAYSNNMELCRQIGFRKTRELLEKEPDIDAILYLTDYHAIGGADYIRQTGRIIGKDILLAGFNDTIAVRTYPFPISSVSLNIPCVGESLLERFTQKGEKCITVPPIPVIRPYDAFDAKKV